MKDTHKTEHPLVFALEALSQQKLTPPHLFLEDLLAPGAALGLGGGHYRLRSGAGALGVEIGHALPEKKTKER